MTLEALARSANGLRRWLIGPRSRAGGRGRARPRLNPAEWLEARVLLSAQLVTDLIPGPEGGQPTMLTAFGNRLVFATAGALENHGLWVTDGTDSGTQRIFPEMIGRDPYQDRRSIATFDNDVLFNGPGGLWKTDGTSDGTALVKALDPFYGSYAYDLTESGGLMYFVHKDRWYGTEKVWRTDGTADGTVLVKDLASVPASDPEPETNPSVPSGTVRVGASAWYYTKNSASELWKTDGTPGGASLVKAFPPNAEQGISGLTDGAGTLYFVVNDGVSGYELWRSDGSTPGTVLVDDINPGPGHSRPSQLTVVDGRLFFRANDGQHGDELWTVDLSTSAPAAPTELVATPASGSEIRLAWNDTADDEAGFVVERSGAPDFASIQSTAKLLPDANGYLDSGLNPGTRYYYRVRSLNRAGSSAGVTASAATPSAPLAPTALSVTLATHDRVELAWQDHSSDEVGFRIERSDLSNFGATDVVYDVGAGVTNFTDTAVAPETDYSYRVAAVGPAGRSAAARAHAGTPGAPPAGLAAWAVSASEVDLHWENPDWEVLYSVRIERAAPGEGFGEVEGTSSLSDSYADGRRAPNTAYRYRVRGFGPHGATLASNEASVETTAPVLATLVKDLNTADTPASSEPSPPVVLDGVGYFAASDEAHGRELWRTDGTSEGTWRVLDLMPGPDGGVRAYPDSSGWAGTMMLAFNGLLYFTADDGSHGPELWKTDGTEAGTAQVADAVPGPAGIAPTWLTNVNGTLFFASATRPGLWKTDGTAAGTVRVKQTEAMPGSAGPGSFIAWNDLLYFATDNGANRRTLWRSDGTDTGTVPITTVGSEGRSADRDSSALWLTPMGDALYFSASSPDSGQELWKTDGTADGTRLLKDIDPGGSSNPQRLFAHGNTLLFAASDGEAAGTELWRSDGTEAGTTRVADLAPGPFRSEPFAFTPFKGKVYFLAGREEGLVTLYETDGTTEGTRRVKDLGSWLADPPNMTVIGDALYLVAGRLEDPGGIVLWKSDGTEAGTVAVAPLTLFPRGGSLSAVGGTLVFPVCEGYSGDGGELWRSDGTADGTYLLRNIRILNGSSSPGHLTAANGLVFFTAGADSGIPGGLWRSDGTDAGTFLLRSAEVSNLAAVGNTLFFASSDASGRELWKTDGTVAGTVRVKDVTPGEDGSVLSHLRAAASGTLYFLARPASGTDNDYRLWKSDGTEPGTLQVSDVSVAYNEFDTFRKPRPVVIGDTIYFTGSVPGVSSPGAEIWKSDGTSAGTVRVKNMSSGFGGGDSGLLDFTAVGQTLYFYAWTPQSTASTLWKTDGTEAGTVPVDGFAGSPPASIPVALGPLLIFAASDPLHGSELWRSDGTPGGTFLLSDIYPGASSSLPSEWTVVGDTLYFLATSRAGGRGLWKTDGTAEGTQFVRPVEGTGGTYAFYMLNANGTLFYSDRGHLWRSDGTGAGTVQVLDVADGITDLQFYLGSPAAVVGDRVYVRGFDAAHGRELWSIATALPATPSEPAAMQMGGGHVRVTWHDVSSNETGFLVDRIAPPGTSLLAGGDDGLVLRTFFVDANRSEFTDSVPAGAGAFRYRIRAVNAAGTSAPTAAVAPAGASVVGWNVFYNNSTFDGNDAGAGPSDDGAVAADKLPLPPGQAPTPANYTTYSRGINGIMIDVSGGLPLTALAGMAGVRVRTRAAGDPSTWVEAPTPSLVAIRRGAGADDSDRITFIWPDGAIRNTWLQFTIPAQPQLGIDHDLVYYFGNLVGDTGDSDNAFRVSALDLGRVKQQLNRASDITGRVDFNRDGRVNALDLGLVKANLNKSLASITASESAAASPFLSVAPAANLAGEISARRVWDEPRRRCFEAGAVPSCRGAGGTRVVRPP